MKYKIFLTLLIAAFFLGCASPQKGKLTKKQKASWYLSVEETSCFGKCPMYKMSIDGSGEAVMLGKRFVEPLGRATSNIADSALKELIILAAVAEWDTCKSEYRSGYSDLPSTIVRYSIHAGDTFSVRYESNLAPEDITSIGNTLITYRKRVNWQSQSLD